jgi:hypothetical protein
MDNSFLVRLGLNTEQVETGIKTAEHAVEGFGEQIKDLAKGFAAAFAVEILFEFGNRNLPFELGFYKGL